MRASEVIPTFASALIYPSAGLDEEFVGYPFGLAAGDYDEDGFMDVVVANSTVPFQDCSDIYAVDRYESVSIFHNGGLDENDEWLGFDAIIDISVCGDCAPTEVAFVDVDDDDDLDLVISASDGFPGSQGELQGEWGVYIYLQNSSHTFDFGSSYGFNEDILSSVRGLGIGDFNSDGYPDIAVAGDDCRNDVNEDNGVVYFLSNDHSGEFAWETTEPTGLEAPAFPFDLAVADFDHTPSGTKLDVVTCNVGGDSLSEQTNNGSWDFDLLTTDSPNGCGFWSFSDIGVGRFNVGNADDLALVSLGGGSVTVVFGNDNGGFTTDCDEHTSGGDHYNIVPQGGGCVYPESAFVAGIAVGHLNGGTRPDLVATRPNCTEAVMLLGRSLVSAPGKFQFDNDPEEGYYIDLDPDNDVIMPMRVIIVDLDADGFGDVVTTNHESHNISVAINQLSVGP